MAPGVGDAVVNAPGGQGAVARIADRLLAADVDLDRRRLLPAALAIAAEEDPLHPQRSAAAAVDALIGLGPLQPLLADESISDIMVNSPGEVWIERAGRLQRTDVKFESAASVVAAVERVVAPLGLRIDHASPVVDARLPDGSRLHAVLPPIAPDGPIVAIRRFTKAVETIEELQAQGAVSSVAAAALTAAVAERDNILVCGGTGTGKTTLLNILSRGINSEDRVVTIEDAAELSLSGHVVRLEARPANAEGAGGVPMQHLVRHALRLRPDRIIVGEVRGAEALDMIQAMATGHSGSMSTVHARDAAEALWRLEVLATSGDSGFAPEAIRALLRSALDMVVVMGRHDGARVVRSVVSVGPGGLEDVAC